MKHYFVFLALSIMNVVLLARDAHALPLTSIFPIVSADVSLDIAVWTDRGEGSIYEVGEDARVYFRSNDDCYLTLYIINTDGSTKILFPEYPNDGWIFGGMTYLLADYYRTMLISFDPQGIEYIHAVATRHPRVFHYRVRGDRYSLQIGVVEGDPFLAINIINESIIPLSSIEATATCSYFIKHRVWYPRYLCNGCHSIRNRKPDPYRDVCTNYSISVHGSYDYWWAYKYYPRKTGFTYATPFWRFDMIYGSRYKYRTSPFLNCASGYQNYRAMYLPRESNVSVENRTPHDPTYRVYEKAYTPITRESVRTRMSCSTHTRSEPGQGNAERQRANRSSNKALKDNSITIDRFAPTQTNRQRYENSSLQIVNQIGGVRNNSFGIAKDEKVTDDRNPLASVNNIQVPETRERTTARSTKTGMAEKSRIVSTVDVRRTTKLSEQRLNPTQGRTRVTAGSRQSQTQTERTRRIR